MAPRYYQDEPDPPEYNHGARLSVDPDERVHYEAAPRRSGNWLRLSLIGLFAIGCSGLLWVVYSKGREWGLPDGPVPLIRADQSATKVKPDAQAGAGDLGYNPTPNGPKVERLLPPPEQPLPRPAPVQTQAAPAPLPVQEVAQAPVPQAAPPSQVAPVRPSTATAPALLSAPDGVKAAPVTAAQAAALATTPAGAPFRVQIAATKDEAAAHKEWERIKRQNDDLLGSLTATVVKADLGDRGIFYRVQAGPVADKAAADKLCADLKARSPIGCSVVKP